MLRTPTLIAILVIAIGAVIVYGSGRLPKPRPGFDKFLYRGMVPLGTVSSLLALWLLFHP